VIEENPGNQSEQNSEKLGSKSPGANQPLPVENPGSTQRHSNAGESPKQPKKILVEVIGDDELKPFEKQTVELARQTFNLAQRQASLTVWAVIVAAIAALFVAIQISEMSDANKILASQSESIAAGAAIDEMNTRTQLGVVQKLVEAAQGQVKISAKVFESSERPYIGVDDVAIAKDRPNKKMTVEIHVKNFGTNPAEKATIKSEWFQDGVQLPIRFDEVPDRQGLLFPGNMRSLNVAFANVDMDALESGKSKWSFEVHSTYRWTNKEYRYCEEWRYSPLTQSFATHGKCPTDSRSGLPKHHIPIDQ
jgi:hypothetical protein